MAVPASTPLQNLALAPGKIFSKAWDIVDALAKRQFGCVGIFSVSFYFERLDDKTPNKDITYRLPFTGSFIVAQLSNKISYHGIYGKLSEVVFDLEDNDWDQNSLSQMIFTFNPVLDNDMNTNITFVFQGQCPNISQAQNIFSTLSARNYDTKPLSQASFFFGDTTDNFLFRTPSFQGEDIALALQEINFILPGVTFAFTPVYENPSGLLGSPLGQTNRGWEASQERLDSNPVERFFHLDDLDFE